MACCLRGTTTISNKGTPLVMCCVTQTFYAACCCFMCVCHTQLDIKKLAELAKSSSGRKRMRLDTAAAAQQLKQLLQRDDNAAGSAQQQAADEQQAAGGVQVKHEPQQTAEQSPLAAAAAADGIKQEGDAAAAGAQGQDVKPAADAAQQEIGALLSLLSLNITAACFGVSDNSGWVMLVVQLCGRNAI